MIGWLYIILLMATHQIINYVDMTELGNTDFKIDFEIIRAHYLKALTKKKK